MKVLGITGGTGCGKTTALNCLRDRGGYLIDCDEVYHRLLQEDQDLLEALDKRFCGVVTDGALDRKKLGAIVFADPQALQDLNATIGPFVLRGIEQELDLARSQGAPIAAIDAIGLMESGLGDLCDWTIAVTAPLEDRVRRLVAREGITEDYARLRIGAQKSNEEFSKMCDYTLHNDCDSAQAFEERCSALFDQLLGSGEAID